MRLRAYTRAQSEHTRDSENRKTSCAGVLKLRLNAAQGLIEVGGIERGQFF